MAFDQQKFAPVGGQYTDTPAVYSYQTDDSLVDVIADQYFYDKRFTLEVGDMINCQCSDLYRVLQVVDSEGTCRAIGGEPPESSIRVLNHYRDVPATFASGITYVLGADITIDFPITVQDGSALVGNQQFSTELTYSGTGTMLTGVGANFVIQNVRLACPNAELFNFSGAASFTSNNLLAFPCDTIGTFDMLTTDFFNSAFFVNSGGVTLEGDDWEVFSILKVNIFGLAPGQTGINMNGSLHRTLELDDITFSLSTGGIGLSGLANSGNIRPGYVARVSSCEMTLLDTPLSTITHNDVRWSFDSNSSIPDTVKRALIGFDGNALVTTITVTQTPVLVNAVWAEAVASHFTTTTGGRVTYNGERSAVFNVDVVLSVTSASGIPDARAHVAVNGTAVAAGTPAATTNSKPVGVNVIWQQELQPGDYIEAFISNNTGTENFIVNSAAIRIS